MAPPPESPTSPAAKSKNPSYEDLARAIAKVEKKQEETDREVASLRTIMAGNE